MDELHEVSKQLLSLLRQIPGIRIAEKRLTTVVHYRMVVNVHLSIGDGKQTPGLRIKLRLRFFRL
jgi:hypothetical protein